MFNKFKSHHHAEDSLAAVPDPPIEHQNFDRKESRRSFMSDQSAPIGDASSVLPFSTDFACISLHMDDRIRLLQFSQEIRSAVRTSILNTWPEGIQNEREYHGSWEFKMRGYPWLPSGDNAIHARRLTRGIMQTLYSYGWVLYISTDISQNEGDKDNLFFRHQNPPPAPTEWFSMTFSKGDRLRLIDAPQNVVQDVIGALRFETQSHQPYRLPGVYEVKFNGYPFMASGGETMVSRGIALKLFTVLEQSGYTVAVSLDQKRGGQNGQETDTWHVSRPLGWNSGAPTYYP